MQLKCGGDIEILMVMEFLTEQFQERILQKDHSLQEVLRMMPLRGIQKMEELMQKTLKELPRNLISQLGIYQNQLGRTLNKKLILD